MRIMIAHNFYRSDSPSGENQIVLDEAELLEQGGHTVFRYYDYSDRIATARGRATAAVGSIANPWSGRRFESALDDFQPDVVHVHNLAPLIGAGVIRRAQKRSVPVVHTVHNYRFSCLNGMHFRNDTVCTLCVGKPLNGPGVRHACYRSSSVGSGFVAVGNYLHQESWRSLDGVFCLSAFAEKMLIDSGFDSQRIYRRNTWAPLEPPLPYSPSNVFLYLGRLDGPKGVLELISSWKSIDVGTSKLVIAGSGPVEDDVAAAASQIDNIEFRGSLDSSSLSTLWPQVKAVIVSSRWFEGFPRVIVESWRAGRPVLVNRIGSLQSILQDGGGWVFESASELQEICNLAPQLYLDASVVSRARFEASCSPDTALAQLEQVYKHVAI